MLISSTEYFRIQAEIYCQQVTMNVVILKRTVMNL